RPPAPRRHGAGAHRAGPDTRQTDQPLRRDVCRQRHDHGELDACGGRRHVRADADTRCTRAVPRSGVGTEWTCVRADARPPRRRARESQHAFPPTGETWMDAGVSVDQLIARDAGRHTQLASLELAIESGETAGACDVGFACAYTNTISWRSANTPLPTENNPRVVFERLFGDSVSTD